MKEEQLLHLLKKKKRVCEAILELTQSEESLPAKEWLSILEQKKVFLVCVEEIDAELQPFKQALHMLSQEIAEELDTIRKVIQQILDISAFNQEKRRKAFKQER